MPLVQTRGAASAQGFGEFAQAAVAANYIEDVFSAYVYTGVTGSNVTINNGIDLSGSGGLIWSKGRNGANPNSLTDTVRGVANGLNSGSIFSGLSSGINSFTSTGYVTNQAGSTNGSSGETYVSWTFQKQPKFFDIQTWTGSGANRTISHNLGSVPGCIMVKCLDDDLAWAVYHRSLANTQYLVLNDTAVAATGATWWNSTTPTSSVFSLGTNSTVNASGKSYVAYIFAHDAGGFGLLGTDNVISCGSYAEGGPSTSQTINLGFEAQWIMIKTGSDTTSSWSIFDTMRGFSQTGNQTLKANLTNAEFSASAPYLFKPDATGFIAPGDLFGVPGATITYIAIRRGPMKVPTVGTSVFEPIARTGTGAAATVSTTNLTDMSLIINRDHSISSYNIVSDRLRGPANTTSGSYNLTTNDTIAEYLAGTVTGFNNNNVTLSTNGSANASGAPYINYFFSRAPSFFDEVCYTGTGSNTTFTHNLTVVPELIIVKRRDATGAWDSYSSALANTEYVVLNTTAAKATGATRWNSTTPTSSVFSVGTSTTTNASAGTYVAYLFATCAGVSKVGSYTGTGTTLQINCGFTAGSRFVLIKRTDSTGDWYVWDSARGIVAGNDPYLLLNSTAAEDTSTDYIDTYSAGFEISSTAPAAINASAGTFVFLAIAQT